MLKQPVNITGVASISPLGSTEEEIRQALGSSDHRLTFEQGVWGGRLAPGILEEVAKIREERSVYRRLDPTVLYGLYAGRLLQENYPLDTAKRTGINLGSSRGATSIWEHHHAQFIQNEKLQASASPSTTLGNLSTWLADDLAVHGPVLTHSITCSTALHSVLNAVAWLQADMTDVFLAGGSEAPLTPFTLAQMKALKLTSPHLEDQNYGPFPCKALDLSKNANQLILGEGAGLFRLEKADTHPAIARIVGIGYSTEVLESAAGLSIEADCFQRSMAQALGALPPEEIDAVVLHAPGTLKGDRAEVSAIQKVFCNKRPFLTTHKWKLGHTFGASGIFSLLQAIHMLDTNEPTPLPYPVAEEPYVINAFPEQIDYVLVNAVGFGGNDVSILLSK